MPIRVVKLGAPRKPNEGLRLGTVRRPPRGVPKTEFAKRDFYDVWLPNLSPSAEVVTLGRTSQSQATWAAFERKYRSEMNAPDVAKIIDLLAALSHQTNLAVGCYCDDESKCHRSILKELLAERGASFCD